MNIDTSINASINPNKELLDWAVKNIKEWRDGYTHLRSDKSSVPLFWSSGEWSIGVISESYTHTVNFPVTSVAGKTRNVTFVDAWRTSKKGDWDNSDLKYFTFKTNTPQVITKQEWEEAKMNIDLGGFTKDMLVPGLHVVEVAGGGKYLVLSDNLAIEYTQKYVSWMPLDILIDSLDSWCIVKVYETKTKNSCYHYGNDNYLTLVWKRNPVNKELQELEEQYKILGEKINSLKGKQ